MSTNENTKLLKFFKWWLEEAESDSPDYCVTAYGLCFNACNFRVYTELKHVLVSLYGDAVYPFRGCFVYNTDSDNDEMHLNPERIAFVKSQIKRLEKLNV